MQGPENDREKIKHAEESEKKDAFSVNEINTETNFLKFNLFWKKKKKNSKN